MSKAKSESVFDRLDRARKTLGLPERASLEKIKKSYRELSKLWHPDHCKETPEKCQHMQQRLNEAYAVLMDYCNNYEYSFRREDVEACPEGEDFWWQHFGEF